MNMYFYEQVLGKVPVSVQFKNLGSDRLVT